MQETLPSRQKWLIVGVLVCLTSAAWVLTIYQSRLHPAMAGLGLSDAPPDHPFQMAPQSRRTGE